MLIYIINYRKRLLVAVTLLLSFALFYPEKIIYAQGLTNPAAEAYVLQQIKQGKIADLSLQFPDEKDRVISSSFLEKLLESPESYNVTRYGVRINYAVFNEPLDFRYIQADTVVWLNNCIFEEGVDFSSSHFVKELFFWKSTFVKLANFDNAKMDDAFYISEAIFKDEANFNSIIVGTNLSANSTQFTNSEKVITFNTAKIGNYFFLRNASFAGSVDFMYMEIGIDFDADSARFTNINEDVNFNYAKVDNSIYLNDVVFSGGADFGHMVIGSTFNADDVQFKNDTKETNFNTAQIGQYLFLQNAVFAGSADFKLVNIGIELIASGATFSNPEKLIDFNTLHVGDSAFFYDTTFAGPADFGSIFIGNNLKLDNAKFTSKDATIYFSNMLIGGFLSFQGASFSGPVRCANTYVANNFVANNAQFMNSDAAKKISFNSMQIGGNAFFRSAAFAGPVDFGYLHAGNNLEFDDAKFTNSNVAISLNNMQIGNFVFLRRTIFTGQVDFSYSEVKSNLEADEAIFGAKDARADFGNMKIDGEAWFWKTTFSGGADFNDGVFTDLLFEGTENMSAVSQLSLKRIIINRELLFRTYKVTNLAIESTKVNGPTYFIETHIPDAISFKNSSFSTLRFEKVTWPKINTQTLYKTPSVSIEGMTYSHIEVITDNDNDLWSELITLADQTPYNAQVYTTLEEYFAKQGYPDRADKVYIEYKRRERAEAFSWNSSQWWWNLFLDVFVSYGRSPGRALIWGLLFILYGCFVFRKAENMVSLSRREVISSKVGKHGTLSRKIPTRVISSQPEISYNPFWYSLDLFIPFVDLGYDNNWSPKLERKWAVTYSKLHMLIGWILIPIGLLAITGVIK